MKQPEADNMSDQASNRNQIAVSILLATAFLVGALVIMQAGRLPQQSAFAGDAITGSDGFTMITASSGFGKDTRPYEFCYVIDNHDEMLFIFEIPQANDKRVVLKSRTSLPGLFARARGANTP